MLIVGVPLHVAVPLLSVAEVGAATVGLAYPVAVIVRAVPPAIVFVPVSGTVAVVPVIPVNVVSVHVCVADPVMLPPLV